MRIILLAAAAFALAGCSEQTPAVAPQGASTETPASAEPTPVTDANEMSVAQLGAALLGEWRSTEDDRSSLVIGADGKWSSVYEGDTLFVADWKLFTGDQPPAGAEGPFTPASRYLEVKEETGTFYYELGHVTADAFDMFYTARGNNLAFSRVK